jgi:hypothetical protein
MTLAIVVMSFALWSCVVPGEARASAMQTIVQSQSAQEKAPAGTSANAPPTTQSSASDATTPCSGKSAGSAGSQAPCSPAKRRKPRTQVAADPSGAPLKKVVRNGSTAEPGVQLGPGVSQQQASHQVQLTNQLLVTTDENLKTAASRKLTPEQQETVKQIQSFVNESKAAASDGDVQRAYTLATKAKLLSADLIGH